MGEPTKDETETTTEEEGGNPVDLDVEDMLQDMITLLCGRVLEDADNTARIYHVRGDRMVKYMIHLFDPRRDTGAVIGKKGHTISAMRDFLRAVGGAHNRIYQLDLEDDGGRRNAHGETPPAGGGAAGPAPGCGA